MAGTIATVDYDRLLDHAAVQLRRAGIESPRREARLLLAHAMAVPPGDIASRGIAISQNSADAFSAAIVRRCRREPFAYITGMREFWSLDFTVSRDVLIPRPETETLIESALRGFSSRDAKLRVLDLGTGSGCLLLAFLSERPNATGVGADLSQAALRLAVHNARRLSLEQRAAFIQSHWTAAISGTFDVVFANPPYIPTGEFAGVAAEVAQYEPRLALDGGADGLRAYREIAAVLRKFMAPGAMLFVEAGYGQAPDVRKIFAAARFQHQDTVCDLGGIQRCVVMRADE